MPAAKHFDPVLGVDIHIIQPPGPVPPVPVPHPFIGMVVDPMDYVPILGATVYVAGIPRAQAGTAGKNIPPHIPIGGVFVKPPGNECEIFMGSSTVEVDGDAFSYLALPVLSCQDVGMPPPPRPKKKSKTKSLVLPTSVVLCIPAPVLVGGPPTISLMALGMRAGMAGAGKLFKKAKAMRKARKAKGKKVKAKKGKAKDNAPCGTDAHPVDVVTGACVDEIVDYDPPGRASFRWVRWYDSSERDRVGPMGRGFRHPYEIRLERAEEGFRFIDEMGAEVDFEDPGNGGEPAVAGGRLLRRLDRGLYEILEPRDRFLRFRFLDPGAPAVLVEVERRSKTLELGYDRDHRLAWARDGEGRLYHVEHDRGGRISAIHERSPEPPHEPLHTVLRFAYDADGCLTSVTDAFGHYAHYQYEKRRLTYMRDRRGFRFYYVFDDQGRVVHTKGEDGLWEARFEYRPDAWMTVVRFADGGRWVKLYNELGMVTDVINPDGGMMTRRIDENGRVAEEVEPGGQVITSEYDGFGSMVGRRDHLGRFMPPPWEAPEPPDFDAPAPPTTAAEWEWGALMDPERTGREPLPADALEAVPAEARQALELDRVGTGGEPIDRIDAMGRVVERTHPDGSTETWTYDPEGNPVEHTDRDGSAYRWRYTSWNQIETETDPLGGTIRYEHSLRGQVTRLVDAGGTVSAYERDSQERLLSVTRAGELRERYVWDEGSRLLEKRGANEEALLTIGIGDHGLVETEELATGGVRSYRYDGAGEPVLATTPELEITQARDDGGRRVEDKRDGDGVEHTRAAGRLVETTVLERFTTLYEYRTRREFDIVDPTGARHGVRIHPAGLAVKRLSNGRTEVASYGEGGRGRGKRVAGTTGTDAWTRRFVHSPAGDLREVRDDRDGDTRYDYDAAHRLVGEHRPDGTERAIRYDAAGNILSMPGLSDARFDAGNRLASAGGDRFEHDARQHVSARRGSGGTTRYVYDSDDMLVRIEGPDLAWSAAYDPFGRRAWKESGEGRREFFWDGDRLAAERGPSGALRVYVYVDDEALVPFLFVDYESDEDDPARGRRRFVFTNPVGAPVRVEDDEGRVIWSARLDPYGRAEVDPSSGIELNLRFPGHYLDPETGLHYNRHRYYSPELGRYLQSDPIGAAGGPNVYAYTANPLVQVDVLGLNCGDAKGATKTTKAESLGTTSAKLGDDVSDVAKKVGMDETHLKRLQQRAAAKGETIIVRKSNPESLKWHKQQYKGKDCVSKPVTVKQKTAKEGPHKGLVTKDANPDAPNAPKGHKWDEDGVLVTDPGGNAVHGDYDLQHVSNKDGPVNTNDPTYREGLNEDVCPEHNQFNHGANDDYKPQYDKDGKMIDPGGGKDMGRKPDADDEYLVVEPDGTATHVKDNQGLENYYEGNDSMPEWPYK